MAKLQPAQLLAIAAEQFKIQYPMLQLWQTLADNFYPERSDFTSVRNVGTDFADGLADSDPILARRDLCNSYSAMLRDGNWFKINVSGETDHDGKKWLEAASERQLDFMNNKKSNFVRSTKEGDHDFGTFGQCVLSVELNKEHTGLLYRCWHLRDVAWWEDETGGVSGVVRKWSPTSRELVNMFGDRVHQNIREQVNEKPFNKADCLHVVIPSNMYGDSQYDQYAYVSIHIDKKNNHIMEEVGLNNRYYIIPRFHTIPGNPYAYSPASIIALPNARTLQSMTFTLLEAGERYVRPPMIAQENVIRGDIDLDSNGITYVDEEYDERLGSALQPIQFDKGGFPIGLEMRDRIVDVISSAFYLDKLSLPDRSGMTAYEVAQRMKQYRRENLPLFAPMESEYNGQLCEVTFDLMMQAGFLGSPYDIPESLHGRNVEFVFNSPLTESDNEKKATQFSMLTERMGQAAQFDDGILDTVNMDEAFRDASDGVDTPEKWFYSKEDVTQKREMRNAIMMAQQAEQQEVEQ